MLKDQLKMDKNDKYYFDKAMDKLLELENVVNQYPKWILETVVGGNAGSYPCATLIEREGFHCINTDTGEPFTKEEFYANYYDIYSNKSLNVQYEEYLYKYMDTVDFIINYRIEKEGLFDIEPIAYMPMTNWSSLYIYDVQGDYIAVGYSLEESQLVPLNYIDNCSFIFNNDKFYLGEFLKVY